jgi:hypothetical protein
MKNFFLGFGGQIIKTSVKSIQYALVRCNSHPVLGGCIAIVGLLAFVFSIYAFFQDRKDASKSTLQV